MKQKTAEKAAEMGWPKEKTDRIANIFEQVDENKDGKLQKSELINSLGENFARDCLKDCDTDEDGQVDLLEFTTKIMSFPPEAFDDGCSFLEGTIQANQ